MAAETILQRLDAEFDNPPEQIRAVVDLLEAGCSPQFIHLFRPDEVDDPGEDRIAAIDERRRFLEELEARKVVQYELAAERGHDVEALKKLLADSVDQDLLDDVDHLLRPHEHKAAAQVAALGLDGLVDIIHKHELGERIPQELAAEYVNAERGLNSGDEVLAQVVLDLAERYGEDPELRARVRSELSRGILQARAANPTGDKEGQKKSKAQKRYEQFFGLEEPVRKIPSQRMLALRHAERDKVLTLRLVLPQGRELELFRERFSKDVDPGTPLGQFLDLVYGHAYDSLVHRPCEQTVRHHLKERADRETVRVFGRAVRAQMMSPTLDDMAVAALRASAKSAWFVALGADGQTAARDTLMIPDGEEARAELRQALVERIRETKPSAIAVPHGRREEQAIRLLREVLAELGEDERPRVVAIDETASVVWATSPNARRRHSGTDTGLRATLSLARRLRDPLTELMRVEPRGLGLGQNLTEVHQGMLNRQLDQVLTSCLARIGVDLNRADPALLARQPGISKDLAKLIAKYRSQNGAFEAIEDLKKVDEIDDTLFTLIAGFLRIHGGKEPLDGTAVHPEEYQAVGTLAGHLSSDVPSIIGRKPLGISPQEVARVTGVAPRRARHLLAAIEAGVHDARGRLETFDNQGVNSFDDLKIDQELQGRVSNLTDFGAFLDLGIGQDGLVHISQIPGFRLRDPERALRVGEIITVFVVHLDPKTHRISLSMHKPRHMAEGRPATLGERMAPGAGAGRGRRRGPREDAAPPMNRAARAPEGRRGDRRGGPRPPKPKAGSDPFGGERGGGRGRRGDGPRPGGKPRVITVESEMEHEESLGHKGELKSLSSLANLLGGGKPKKPKADKPKPAEQKPDKPVSAGPVPAGPKPTEPQSPTPEPKPEAAAPQPVEPKPEAPTAPPEAPAAETPAVEPPAVEPPAVEPPAATEPKPEAPATPESPAAESNEQKPEGDPQV